MTSQRQKIKEMRLEGKTYSEMATALGISINAVRSYIRTLIVNGEIKPYSGNELTKRHKLGHKTYQNRMAEKVLPGKEMRDAGHTTAEIASAVGVSRTTVDKYIGPRTGPTHKQQQLLTLGKKMREEGHSSPEIGKVIGVSPTTVDTHLGPRTVPTKLQQQLISLRKSGHSYDEIAAIVGKPRGTIAVILARMIKKGLVERGRVDASQRGKSSLQPEAERVAKPA